MTDMIAHLGPLFYPLLALSLAGATVIIERLCFFLFLPKIDKAKSFQSCMKELEDNARVSKALRDELLSFRVATLQRKLMRGVHILRMIAVLSPMLGLLGTVTGMIDAFGAISDHDGPVEPSLIAGGIQSAMFTTAYGLCAALPCLAAAFMFARMAEKRLCTYTARLNTKNLEMEGVTSL